MATYLKSLLILCYLAYQCAGQLYITGNEVPLIIGLPRDINCTWTGGEDVTKMEWWGVGIGDTALETANNAKLVVLGLEPNSDGLDGAMFTCRATLTNGSQIEETISITLEVIENSVRVSSLMDATAGQPYTLICTVSSARPSEINWIDPNGVPCPLNGPDVYVSHGYSLGQISTLELNFNSIRTSQSGVYKCISNIIVPLSKAEDSYLVEVQIPAPMVTIIRDPELPVQFFTGHRLVLTCVIELIPEIDSYVAITSQWRGHSSLTDQDRRVIVSDLEGVQLMYNTSVTINETQTADSGSYVCTAEISPLPGVMSLIESPSVTETITISVVIRVLIEVSYNPPSDFTLPSPPYYRPATTVSLTCRTYGTTGSVSYQWNSTCSSCFVSGSTSQTVSDSILQSIDAGIHTCTATDSNSNTGSDSTEMRLIGAGIYVQYSEHINDRAVADNSLIVQRSYSTRVSIYCCSNSTSQSVGYYYLSNWNREYSDSRTYNYVVTREGYGCIRLYSYSSYSPDIWGIFTCQISDSRNIIVENYIGIYSSMPSAPSVYSISYTDWSSNRTDILGSVECLTQYSPPTTMTWYRDGVEVEVDGKGYEMIQQVTERRSYSRYNNTLSIQNAAHLAGNHRYCCIASNDAGNSTTECINTTWEAQPVIEFSTSREEHYLEPFELECYAILDPNVAFYLLEFLRVDWVKDGQNISAEDNVTAGRLQYFTDRVAQSLYFDSLSWAHCGNYTCVASLVLPETGQSFITVQDFHLNVFNTTIIQLKFGLVPHCSKWYQDRSMASHLEHNIKNALTSVMESQCDGGFQLSQIDDGEFSCHNLTDGDVMFRARLTGNCNTCTIPELLEMIEDWILSDGTFLFNYHGNIRLGLDKECPLEVGSFSAPECKNNRAITNMRIEL